MLRSIPLLSLIFAVALAGCLVQPTAAPLATPTPIGTPRPSGSPTPAPAATPTPKQVIAQGLAYKQYDVPPLMTIDPSALYTAVINTNKGSMTLELYAQDAPNTVNNFVFLAREGFYNGLIFHRVIPQFMIQTGDPTGTGGGGPGYQFEDEFASARVFDAAGILAMANAGANTNGSQFFITVVPTPHLNGSHTIFGKVTQGQQVAEAISLVPASNTNRPIGEVVIRSIEITRDGG